MSTDQRFKNYSAFFPFYLSQHTRPVCRSLHYIGTCIEIASVVAFIATWNPLFLLTAVVGGYGFAWVGHFVFEKNKPATFRYPLWSYIGDHHMLVLAISGRLRNQLKDVKSGQVG